MSRVLNDADLALEREVLWILQDAWGRSLSLSEIADELGRRGLRQKDTVVVRDIVWGLLRQGKVNLTPRRRVILTVPPGG